MQIEVRVSGNRDGAGFGGMAEVVMAAARADEFLTILL